MPETKAEGLYLRQRPVGPMKNFAYLVGPADGDEVAIVDPAWEPDALEAQLAADGKRLVALLVTHHHADHCNAVAALLERHDVPVYVQRAELDASPTLRAWGDAARAVGPGEVVRVGSLEVTCVHTPGHTPGSQCFSCRAQLFGGDTVFVGACGRCDLPGGDVEALYDSLHRVLGRLDDATALWPGHDYGATPSSTLGEERRTNRYLTVGSLAEFVARRLPR